MVVYLDTSTLVKVYVDEQGRDDLLRYFSTSKIKNVFISEITLIEFNSALFKKFRSHKITNVELGIIINKFNKNLVKYNLVILDSDIIMSSRKLVNKYGEIGLRTLDSIQLTSAISVRNEIEEVLSSDNKLNEIFLLENFKHKVF